MTRGPHLRLSGVRKPKSIDMTDTNRRYELAYHLDGTKTPEEVPALHASVEQIVTSHGGIIVESKAPEATRLSYPIQHQRSSFFGWCHFTLEDTDQLALIDEALRLTKEVLRHIVLTLDERVAEAHSRARSRTPRAAQPDMDAQLDSAMNDVA